MLRGLYISLRLAVFICFYVPISINDLKHLPSYIYIYKLYILYVFVYLYKYILYNRHMTYIIGIYNKTKIDMREKEN